MPKGVKSMRTKNGFIFLLLIILITAFCLSIFCDEKTTEEEKKEEITIKEFNTIQEFISAKPPWYDEINIQPYKEKSISNK